MRQTEQGKNGTPHETFHCCRYSIERSPLPMAATEGRTHIVRYVNPAFCLLADKPRESLMGRPFIEAVPKGEAKRWSTLLDRVFHTGASEIAGRARDSVSWSYTIWAVPDEEKHPAGVMILITDRTRRALERQRAVSMNEEIVEINQRLLITGIHAQELAEHEQQIAVFQERNRIAQDIHDTLAQGFVGILAQLEAAIYAPEQEQGRLHMAHARDLARQSLQEARRLVRAQRPQALEGEKLPGALTLLVAQITSTIEASVTFQVHGVPYLLPEEVENHLFRIGQEALTNAIKHAEATMIQVELSFEPSQTRLCVQDDGKGFEFPSGFQGNGFGLIGMYERVERIGGRMALTTRPGYGTSITVKVPTAPVQTKERLP